MFGASGGLLALPLKETNQSWTSVPCTAAEKQAHQKHRIWTATSIRSCLVDEFIPVA
jgi:hypothetical protein